MIRSSNTYPILYLCHSLLIVFPNSGYTDDASHDVGNNTENSLDSPNADSFFDDIQAEDDTAPVALLKNKRVSGKLKTEVAYNTERTDKDLAFSRKDTRISKLKTSLSASFEDKIGSNFNYKTSVNGFYDAYYKLSDNSSFSNEQIDTFEAEAELRENYLRVLFTKNTSLTIGRQIIAWGESEVTPVVDVINPRNAREFGQTPLDETRIPVSAARLSTMIGDFEANLVYSFEFRGNKTGVNASDFDPYIPLRGVLPIANPRKPYSFFVGGEQYLRLKKEFKNSDLSFFLSNSYNKSETPEYNVNEQQLGAIHKQYQLIGLSGNFAAGSWLTRLELAYKRNIAELRGDLISQISANTTNISSWSEKDIIQSTIGAEYYGLSNTTITIEWSPTAILDYENNLANDQLSSSYLFYVRRTLLNERITVDFSWFKFSNNNGDIIRTNVEYEYRDGIRLSLSYIMYAANKQDSFMYNYRNNDRISSSISYFF